MELETRAEALPTQGKSSKQPWNAYWWPYKAGGLNRRWISPEEPSPVEKLDMADGQPNRGTDWELQHRPSLNVDWGGQCDGFAIASVLEPEPRYPVKYGGICFAAGDVKGLLGALYMGDMSGQRVDVLGRDTFDQQRMQDDLDPATFHLALANVMGLHSEGIYLDVGKNGEIYNKPISSYSSHVQRHGQVLEVETVVQVVKYLTVPEVVYTRGRLLVAPMRLSYELDLDDEGNILPGGRWTGDSSQFHPTSMKIPRGTSVQTRVTDPYIDPQVVRDLASRSANASGPECWPENAPHHGPPDPSPSE
jgi:hypothetical protein